MKSKFRTNVDDWIAAVSFQAEVVKVNIVHVVRLRPRLNGPVQWPVFLVRYDELTACCGVWVGALESNYIEALINKKQPPFTYLSPCELFKY